MKGGIVGLGLLVVLFMFLFLLEPLPVHAASTLVQSNNSGCSCASLPVSFGSSVVGGNLLVVGVTSAQGATLSTLSDSKGSSFTQAVTSTAVGRDAYIFYATLSSGGSDTVTANFNAGNFANIYIYEVSGVLTTGVTTGHNAGSSNAQFTSPTAFLNGAFLLGVVGTNNFGFTATQGAGFTLSPTTAAGGGVGFAEYSTSGVSPPTTTFPTSTDNAVDWAEAGIALQPAPTPPIPEYPLGLPIFAILMLIGYGLVRRRNRNGPGT